MGLVNKPKLLLIGYRAWGDFLYSLPALNYLFSKYEVHLEMNKKGWHLFGDDPRFVTKTVFDPWDYDIKDQWQACHERWEKLEQEIKPDKTINLWRTLETECITERYQEEFFLPVKKRQALFGNKSFYDSVLTRCEVPKNFNKNLADLYFTPEQVQWGESFKKQNEKYFTVLMVVAGSCSQKVYPDMPELSYDLLNKYPDLKIYLAGDKQVQDIQWEHDRIISTAGIMPFKQSILMAKYVDFVFGGETGLLVAAGMWGTPKTMLCTSASKYQAVKYHENDFSLQAGIECSPCHRAIYCVEDCESMIQLTENEYYPACTTAFSKTAIQDIIETRYNEYKM